MHIQILCKYGPADKTIRYNLKIQVFSRKFLKFLTVIFKIIFQVKIWFQNRRAKERRALKKQEDNIVKDKLDPTSAAAAACAAAAAAANFPFSDSFHPPPSTLDFGSPPPPPSHHFGTTPMKFE